MFNKLKEKVILISKQKNHFKKIRLKCKIQIDTIILKWKTYEKSSIRYSKQQIKQPVYAVKSIEITWPK